jgi:hypothetical protein
VNWRLELLYGDCAKQKRLKKCIASISETVWQLYGPIPLPADFAGPRRLSTEQHKRVQGVANRTGWILPGYEWLSDGPSRDLQWAQHRTRESQRYRGCSEPFRKPRQGARVKGFQRMLPRIFLHNKDSKAKEVESVLVEAV